MLSQKHTKVKTVSCGIDEESAIDVKMGYTVTKALSNEMPSDINALKTYFRQVRPSRKNHWHKYCN